LLLNDTVCLRKTSPTLHIGWYLTPYHPQIPIALTRFSCLFAVSYTSEHSQDYRIRSDLDAGPDHLILSLLLIYHLLARLSLYAPHAWLA
jgi:hypothetical protein